MSATLGNKGDRPNHSSGYSGAEEHSGPLHAFLEHSTLLIFPVLFLLNLHWPGSRLYELELLWLIALAVPLGIVGATLFRRCALGRGHLRPKICR